MLRLVSNAMVLVFALGALGCENSFSAPLKVAVILDIERTWDVSTLEWAKENINVDALIPWVATREGTS